MRKFEYKKGNISLPEYGTREFSYYITIDETEDTGPAGLVELYGVGVSLGEEDSNIPAITTDADKIINLIELLSENFVTPIGLGDVVNDLLGVLI